MNLTTAQSDALRAIREGRYEDVKSGPHLKALAEAGLIVRGDDGGRYVVASKPCSRGSDTCGIDCCSTAK